MLNGTIFTVFPKDESYLPQDFATMDEALQYANELECDSTIEACSGCLV